MIKLKEFVVAGASGTELIKKAENVKIEDVFIDEGYFGRSLNEDDGTLYAQALSLNLFEMSNDGLTEEEIDTLLAENNVSTGNLKNLTQKQ